MEPRHVGAPHVDDALATQRREDVKVERAAMGVVRIALALCGDMQPHEILGDRAEGSNRPSLSPLLQGVRALLDLSEKNLGL